MKKTARSGLVCQRENGQCPVAVTQTKNGSQWLPGSSDNNQQIAGVQLAYVA
jgi:hypothetical protein